jgi:hypothetical protein
MRGEDVTQEGLFSYFSLEERVPANHLLQRPVPRRMPLLRSPLFAVEPSLVKRPVPGFMRVSVRWVVCDVWA